MLTDMYHLTCMEESMSKDAEDEANNANEWTTYHCGDRNWISTLFQLLVTPIGYS